MPDSGSFFLLYSEPRPFTGTARIEITSFPPPNLFSPRETLHYSAQTLEEIMNFISTEYSRREITLPIWKRYKKSTNDFDAFNPNPDGSNLAGSLVAWFPQ